MRIFNRSAQFNKGTALTIAALSLVNQVCAQAPGDGIAGIGDSIFDGAGVGLLIGGGIVVGGVVVLGVALLAFCLGKQIKDKCCSSRLDTNNEQVVLNQFYQSMQP